MALIEFDPHNLQKVKFSCHIIHAILLFFIFILEIVVFSKARENDGRLRWQFGLVFMTIPALIFLTMTLRFPRTRKFAHPYALACCDCIFTILWISGFICQASYNATKKCAGACGLSKVVIGLGIFTWLMWVLTSIFSLYGVMYWKREGYLPGTSRIPYNASVIDPDKEAFSTAPYDDEYVAVQNIDEHENPYYSASMTHQSHAGSFAGAGHMEDYGSPRIGDNREELAYQGYTGASGVAGERVKFPEARYDNV